MTSVDMQATNLPAARLAELREQADKQARADGGFVDPRRMRSIESKMLGRPWDWCSAILGRPFTGLRSAAWREWILLDLACDAEPEPPVSPARRAQEEAAQRAEAERRARETVQWQAKVDTWTAIRAAMPVPVSTAFNYSRHTYEFHVHGGQHIVVWGDLRSGRLTRKAGQALCETPSKARMLHLDNSRLERAAQDEGREVEPPTCKACLAIARRTTGVTA